MKQQNKKINLCKSLSLVLIGGGALATVPIALTSCSTKQAATNPDDIFNQEIKLKDLENYKDQGTKHSEKLLNDNDATSYMAKNYNQLDLKQSMILYLNTFILPNIYKGVAVKDYLDADKTFLYIEAIRKTSDNLFDVRIYLWLTLQRELDFTFDSPFGSVTFPFNAGDDAKLSIYLEDDIKPEDALVRVGNVFCRTDDDNYENQIIKGNNIKLQTLQTDEYDINIDLSTELVGHIVDVELKQKASWTLPLASNYSECQFPQNNS